MLLLRARQWIDETFAEGSRPRVATVRKWIEIEQIPGRIINGIPYVDAEGFAVQDQQRPSTTQPNGADLLL